MTKIFIEKHTLFNIKMGLKLEKMKKMHFFFEKNRKKFWWLRKL